MLKFRSKKYQEKMAKVLQSDDILKNAEKEFNFKENISSNNLDNFWEKWQKATMNEQKNLATMWMDKWQILLRIYADSDYAKKILIIEVLAYIKNSNVVDFLLNQMQSSDEALAIACSSSLKKQDAVLLIEPMIEAINNPQMFAVARIYDILADIGVHLVPLILQKMPTASVKSKVVMVQLLGEFADSDIIDDLINLLDTTDYGLRKAIAEAISKINSPKSIEALENLLKDKSWQIRLIAVKAIKEKGAISAYNKLEEAYLIENDRIVKVMLEETLRAFRKGDFINTSIWERIG